MKAFPSSRLSARWLIFAALLFGLLCRLSQYAANTSLWHDEAFVALNILNGSFQELLGPLEWNEASPPGFLIVEKLVASRLGRSEYALRLVPLLAGLAGLISFSGLAGQVGATPGTRLWAVLLMAGSAKLVVQSNEVKHFTLDLLWAVLLSLLVIQIWRSRRPGGLLLLWGAMGGVGLWFSFASLFVTAGASVVLMARLFRTWHGPQRAAYLAANLLLLASLVLLLNPIQAQLTGQLRGFWAGAFPDTSGLLALLYWFGRAQLGLFNYFWQPLGAALLALAVWGTVGYWRTGRRPELWLLALPILMALMASSVRFWPFGGNQHMVFAAPGILLLVAEGTETLRLRLTRRRRRAGWAFIALLMLPGLADAAYRVVSPRQRHEIRPVIEFVRHNLRRSDQLLVFCPAEYQFYTGEDFRHASVEPDRSLRVWFIATRSGYQRFPVQELLDRLESGRPRLLAMEQYGAAAYLFGPEPDLSLK